jgi:hypothetical protein
VGLEPNVLEDVLANGAVIFIHMGGYHPWGLVRK